MYFEFEYSHYNPSYGKAVAFNMVCYTFEQLDFWLAQNKATEIDEFAYGCLLDNFSMFGKRCKIWVFEKYVNANMSCFDCYAIPYKAIEDYPVFRDLANSYDNRLYAMQEEEGEE